MRGRLKALVGYSGQAMSTTPTCFVLPIEQRSGAILLGMHAAGVELLVVGAMAGVLRGLSSDGDLEIVHQRSPENAARLLAWLLAHDAHDRAALPDRKLRPTEETLLSDDEVRLQTNLGTLLLRSALSGRYESMLPDTVLRGRDQIERATAPTAHTDPVEDRAILPVMIVERWPMK
jgi:hypothetical protein